MRAIILAAGQGSRLSPLTDTTHKSMLPYNNEPIIHRLVSQLKKHGIENILIVVGHMSESIIEALHSFKDILYVENKIFKEDVNIYSMYLAINTITNQPLEDAIVFEADMIVEDELINYVLGSDFEDQSVWFTSGRFTPDQYGGILKTNGKGKVVDIQIVDSYNQELDEYKKLTGIMRISPKEQLIFRDLLKEYSAKSTNQYYLIPWLKNLAQLPSIHGDASHYNFATFNTEIDYNQIQKREFDPPKEYQSVELLDIDLLTPIEDHDKDRLEMVKNHVIRDGFWTQPLRIEKQHHLVLDGHHRLELAKSLGLKSVPVIQFEYQDIAMWTLREEIPLDKDTVINHAKEGQIYPYKTVKHKFPNVECTCKIKIEELKCV